MCWHIIVVDVEDMVKAVRWRYVVFEVVNGEVDGGEIASLIWRQIYSLFGSIEGSKFGFRLLEYDEEKGVGIARVSWLYVNHFRVVLATLNMQKEGLIVNEVLVAGTQASLKRKFKEDRLWRFWREKVDETISDIRNEN